MSERFHIARGGQGADMDRHVRALRAAYDGGRLLVSADSGALARARLEHGHAIDARDVADAMLKELLWSPARRQG